MRAAAAPTMTSCPRCDRPVNHPAVYDKHADRVVQLMLERRGHAWGGGAEGDRCAHVNRGLQSPPHPPPPAAAPLAQPEERVFSPLRVA